MDGKGYKGVIFNSNYKAPYRTNLSKELRFTPSTEEIRELETQLRIKIKVLNKGKINQGRHYGPVIHRNLKKYIRQYIGLITPEGERVIYVNFLWNKLNLIERIKGYSLWSDGWQEAWITVHDGGSSYWQLKYVLNDSRFIDFYVNGIA